MNSRFVLLRSPLTLRHWQTRSAVITLFGAVGCSNSDDGRSDRHIGETPAIDSAVDETLYLSELTEEQAAQYCDDVLTFGRVRVPSSRSCLLDGFSAALEAYDLGEDPRGACDVAYEACLPPTDEALMSACDGVFYDAACRATVGQALTCNAKTIETLSIALDQIPYCEELEVYFEDPWTINDPMIPTECEDLHPTCTAYP